ncbi:MAG: hypothetical protein LBQ88_17955 [Treponema sp.]|jgi:hypothetical protein|nr:hypothetical protein [Treponema sp.]
MKRFFLVFLCLHGFALFAQVPPDWDRAAPPDTEAFKYSVGVSTPSLTEQDAFKSAWANALQNFASSIGTYFSSQTDISVRSAGFDSEIEDAFTLYLENSSFSTQVRLSGVREAARKTEPQNGAYIVRVLAVMGKEDYQKAVRYVENEEASFRAYTFFRQKVPALAPLSLQEKPRGFPDYYTWLRSTCVILTVQGDTRYLGQLELFVKKLFKNALVYAEILEGEQTRLVYDAGLHYGGIVRALEDTGLFAISKDNSRLVLRPAGSLNAFQQAADGMKDASALFVTGLEVIETPQRRMVNTENLVVNQFKSLASRQYRYNTVQFSLPPSFTGGAYLDETGIIGYITANRAAFPARYALICYAETRYEAGIAEYRVPALITAYCHATLFDVITGEAVSSETIDTKGFVFSPATTREDAVVSESRRALRFLFDAKNGRGLPVIMEQTLGAR